MVNTLPPLISVIMPAYNAERFIEKAIESVLSQTYENWELLVVDDASSDQTASIVKSIKDSRIKYNRVARIGSPAGVRNVGLKLAQGDFIAFLDADDLYFPSALEKLAQTLISTNQLTAAYGFALYMDEAENPMRQDVVLIPTKQKDREQEIYELPPHYPMTWEKILTGQLSCLLPALMIRRSTFERVGFFNEKLCGPEDYEYYLRLYLDHFEGVASLPHYIYRYRVYSSSLTKAPEHTERILKSALQIMDWLFTDSTLPPQMHYLKSKAYISCYRYFARERLIHQQAKTSRFLLRLALQNSNIQFFDWFQQCASLFIRSLLPPYFNATLIQAWAQIKNQYYRFKLQALQPSSSQSH